MPGQGSPVLLLREGEVVHSGQHGARLQAEWRFCHLIGWDFCLFVNLGPLQFKVLHSDFREIFTAMEELRGYKLNIDVSGKLSNLLQN